MARIHARKKGRSGSHAIERKDHPSWSSISSKDVEKLVLEKSKEGLSTAQIGATLRDSHGIPSVKLATNLSINNISDNLNTRFTTIDKNYSEISNRLNEL